MLNCELETVLTVHNKLGEGVIWDDSAQCLWWTDILSKKMYRWQFGHAAEAFDTPFQLCSFGLTPIENKFIVAFDFGFAFYEPLSGKVEKICDVEAQNSANRMNDGRVDRQGYFWAGSMRASGVGKLGALYSLSNLQSVCHLEDIEISNSLCWSLDGTRIYHADSPTQKIRMASVDPLNGLPGSWKTFVQTDKGAYPDGACIDSEDHLWSAQWGSHKIKRYNPLGEQVFEFELPCEQPSCITFGGPQMQHIFVTSAWDGLAKQPNKDSPDGNVFILKSNVKGIAESICTQY